MIVAWLLGELPHSREAAFQAQPLPANTRMHFFIGGGLRGFWLAADTAPGGARPSV